MKIDVQKAVNENVTIGYGSYVAAKFCVYDPNTKVIIGKFTCIASETYFILGGNHRKDFVTQYPFNDSDIRESNPDIPLSDVPYDCSCGNISVGSDVWIGHGCKILSGATIGHGAVIGADSVVRSKTYDQYYKRWRDEIPAYAIVVGNPGIITGYRFEGQDIYDLVKIAWWDWSLEKIKEAMPLLHSGNVKEFINQYRGK